MHICCDPPQFIGYTGYQITAINLIRRGADVNAKGKDGETPLSLAIKTGQYNLANTLILTGAKTDITITGKRL